MPSNGLIYAPPDACACFPLVKLGGFFAAGPDRTPDGQLRLPKTATLERGPAYGFAGAKRADSAADWPAFRHDGSRSGVSKTSVPSKLKQRWSVQVGPGRLTQPVVAGDLAVVAVVDRHVLHGLDTASGRKRWSFVAGGRIDSPPTLHRGMVIFGSADGWAYCLRADDGVLIWRLRAAPEDRLVGVFGQLESAWPVHGSPLVQNGQLYLTAGRSSYLDGGIILYRLEPATGKVLSRTIVWDVDPTTGRQKVVERRGTFDMVGTTSDVLSGNGDQVFMKARAFTAKGVETKQTAPHLFGIAGFLDEDWFVRHYWKYGTGVGAGYFSWANVKASPFGRILCIARDKVYGYGRAKIEGGPTGHRAEAYRLFCRPVRKGAPSWSDSGSLTVRAMALAGDKLVVAGPRNLGKKSKKVLDFVNRNEAVAAFRGQKGAFVRVVSASNGKTLSELELPGMPVFDGLAVARSNVYIATRDGKLICLGE